VEIDDSNDFKDNDGNKNKNRPEEYNNDQQECKNNDGDLNDELNKGY